MRALSSGGGWARIASPAVSCLVFCACSDNGATDAGAPYDASSGLRDAVVEGATVIAEAQADAGASDGAVEGAAGRYVPDATALLDDMIHLAPDGMGTMTGSWGTYSDRAVSWSQPPVFNPKAPGVLVPEQGTPVMPTTDGGPIVFGTARAYRRFYGGGETAWGAGLGMNFAGAPPDGGAVSVNECEAGVIFDVDAAGMDSVIEESFDATGWIGIQFWARSFTGFGQPVGVLLSDARSNPFALPFGQGGCNVCSATINGCGDGPRADVVFPPEWTPIQVPFDSMRPAGWSGASTMAPPELNALYLLDFQLDAILPTPPFDIGVAYLELYR